MSLTYLLDHSSDLRKMIPNLKSQLTDSNGKTLEKYDWKAEILVPSIGKSYEAGTIGTSFDYVARCILTKIVGTKNVTSRSIVAENGARSLQNALQDQDQALMYEKDESIRKERAEGYKLAQEYEDELMQYIETNLDLAKEAMCEFSVGKLSLEKLVPYTIFLARLDAVFRAGSVVVVDTFLKSKFGKSYFSQKLTITDDQIADNVVQLAKIFEKYFKGIPMSHVSLNPVFLPYSCLVGGADADFIYDSTLIDIKAVTKFSYKGIDWAQVLGYAAMALAIDIEIKEAGIYFARYGKSAILKISPEMRGFLFKYLDSILETALELNLWNCPNIKKPFKIGKDFLDKLRKEKCTRCL
ncbi:MAG: hypothetical protein C0175_00720 [Caldisericum exile]|uniref:Uncharacterized protein n=1 Tax=Caldisericum exile TaxID=693075 RepID=A0A2J6X9K8_9BACT|nr:MAG: hypothetical protein C0175_00720 [Caldisericum exile]